VLAVFPCRRYKKEKSGKGASLLKRVNFHSTRKKTMRLNQKLFHSDRSDRNDFREFHRSEDRVRMMEQVW
jgi:hypothetical protein